jgi:hypothetical protein
MALAGISCLYEMVLTILDYEMKVRHCCRPIHQSITRINQSNNQSNIPSPCGRSIARLRGQRNRSHTPHPLSPT